MYSDGGARGNPGKAATAFFIFEEKNLIAFDGEYLGVTTNNIAEYKALLLGLQYSLKKGIKNINCKLDSELVVKQLKGEYKVKNAGIKPIFEEIKSMLSNFDSVNFEHIKREKNKNADKLVNVILDSVK